MKNFDKYASIFCSVMIAVAITVCMAEIFIGFYGLMVRIYYE